MIYTLPALPTDFDLVIQRIDALRAQLKYQLQGHPRRWIGSLRRSTFAKAIRASNSIEGYNVTYEDAVAAVDGDEPMDEKTEAWFAVEGYRNAMTYILQLADDPLYVHNEGTIRGLHFMMIGHEIPKHPGRWRPGSIYVRNEPSGEIVYEGPDVEFVPQLMTELIGSLNAVDSAHALVGAAMAHLNLVMIHPFSDGNGRMGRALQTFMLARQGILDPTFSSIEEYLGRNTLEYYSVLAEVGRGKWHPENDALPWVKFCLIAHYRQAETLLRRMKELARLWDIIENKVKNLALNERTAFALADAAMGYRVRNTTYRAMAEVSDQVASRDLHVLCDRGLLEPVGHKRGRHYVAGSWLKAARRYVRERKITTDPFTEDRVELPVPEQQPLPGFE
jgi:Fic family protein